MGERLGDHKPVPRVERPCSIAASSTEPEWLVERSGEIGRARLRFSVWPSWAVKGDQREELTLSAHHGSELSERAEATPRARASNGLNLEA